MNDFLEAARMLRAYCPTEFPVMVRRVSLKDGFFGDCSKGEKAFLVRVNKALDKDFQIWVLVHEYAHAMAWGFEGMHESEHTPHFGVCYARAYNAVFDPGAV